MLDQLEIDKHKEEAIRLYESGKTMADIGRKYDCHDETIRRRLIYWGVHVRTMSERFKGVKKSPEHAAKLRDNLNKQRSLASKASKLRWSLYRGEKISRKDFLDIQRKKAIKARKLIPSSGHNNPNWKGGYSATYFRGKVLNRDKHKCKLCGYKKHPEILEVHHIDGNHYNNVLGNGITVCPNCHKVEEYKRKTFITRRKK